MPRVTLAQAPTMSEPAPAPETARAKAPAITPGQLMYEYNAEILESATVCNLLFRVSQDPIRETVDMAKTLEEFAFVSMHDPAVQQARRLILGWLSLVCFGGDLTNEFWFEMHTRMEKLITVSSILEARNLHNMGGIPDATDIPTALVKLHAQLREYRKNHLKADTERHLEMLGATCVPRHPYMVTTSILSGTGIAGGAGTDAGTGGTGASA